MATILVSFTSLFAIIALGWLLARTGVARAGADRALTRLSFAGLLPALLFHTVALSSPRSVFSAGSLANVISASILAFGYAALAHYMFKMRGGELTIGALAASYTNAGNLGVAFLLAITGQANAAAPIMLFQLCVMVPIAFSILEYQTGKKNINIGKIFLRSFTNPPVIAVIAGLVVAIVGWKLPTVIEQPVQMLASAAVPIMLIAMGISSYGTRIPRPGKNSLPLYVAVVFRTVLGPACTFAIGYMLGVRGAELLAITIAGGFPTANNVFVYAHRFRVGVDLARDSGIISTATSVVVIIAIAALYHSSASPF